MLVKTVIAGSLQSLENRVRQHKRKAVRRLLLSTGRILVDVVKLFLGSVPSERLIGLGKGFLRCAGEIDSNKFPDDQIAAFLYKLKEKHKNSQFPPNVSL